MACAASDATAVTFVADDGYTAEMALDGLKGCADCIVAFLGQPYLEYRQRVPLLLPRLGSSAQIE